MINKNIEKYNILIKLSLLIYIILKSIDKVNYIYIVTFSLVYIVLSITYFLFYKKELLILNIIISLFTCISYIPIVSIIYSFSLIELFLSYNKLKLIPVALSVVPVIYDTSCIIEYIVFTLIGYGFIAIYNDYIKVINEKEKEIEEKRKYIHSLNQKLEKSEEFIKQSIYTTKLEERNQLSQNIHDKIGHTIAGSLMQLEATKIVISRDSNKATQMIDNTINVLRIGMDDIRIILRTINPADEQIGINKIKMLLEEKTKNTRFKFKLTYNGDLNKINKRQWMCIYEGIRELSTNSMKYSRGNNLDINIEVFNKLIKTEVKDNGIGSKTVNKNLGLNSIEQRVVDLDGKILIDGSDGFSVVLLLPIDKI